MKDIAHHLKHLQKKVINSSRKEENNNQIQNNNNEAIRKTSVSLKK